MKYTSSSSSSSKFFTYISPIHQFPFSNFESYYTSNTFSKFKSNFLLGLFPCCSIYSGCLPIFHYFGIIFQYSIKPDIPVNQLPILQLLFQLFFSLPVLSSNMRQDISFTRRGRGLTAVGALVFD